MKILYITNGIVGAGGLERVLAIKASYLADVFGHEVHILTLNQGTQKQFYEFSPKIKLHDVAVGGNPMQYFSKYRKGIVSVVKAIKPEVISVCDDGLKGFFLPLILSKPCPMIYERHTSKIIEQGQNPGFLKKLKTRFTLMAMDVLAKHFDKFVVLTKGNLQEWNLKNIIVIANPLSFYPDESSSLQQKKVIAVGTQGPTKGYDLLLQSWKRVNATYPDWSLDIYGKEDPSQKYDELKIALGIEDSVRFHPPVQNIEQKYLESAIYAMSSRFEGFGMVLIEAMACGVPCVSFACPFGPADIITDGVDGILAKNGNIDDLATQLMRLMTDDDLRISMGKQAKINVRRYQPEIIVKQWDELFRTLVS